MRLLVGLLVVLGVLSARLPGYGDAKYQQYFSDKSASSLELVAPTPNCPIDETQIVLTGGAVDFGPGAFSDSDGTCNNNANQVLGASAIQLTRLVPAAYSDTIGDFNGGADFPVFPNPREVSNAVAVNDPALNDKDTTALLVFFGQFMDHDFALTLETNVQVIDVPEPLNELAASAFIDPAANESLIFDRSIFCDGTGVTTPREFATINTPWLDLGNTYGDQVSLETLANADMTSRDPAQASDLIDTVNLSLLANVDGFPIPDGAGGFLCGDRRCPENSQLFAWHSLWIRSHNELARQIDLNTPGLPQVEIFELARTANIAMYQSIIWTAYLPYLLGRRNLYANNQFTYTYDPTETPVCSVFFTTASFRYGHSGIVNELSAGALSITLQDAFMNPGFTMDGNGGDGDQVVNLLNGQGSTVHPVLDQRVVDNLRNNLFREDANVAGRDLIVLNLMRARDHGLGTFNQFRDALGVAQITCDAMDQTMCFQTLTQEASCDAGTLCASLMSVYPDFDSVDLWIAGMSEPEFQDSLLGETFTASLVDQFTRMRAADRFWYEGQMPNLELVLGNVTFQGGAQLQLPVRAEQVINFAQQDNTASPAANLFQLSPVVVPGAALADDSAYVEWWYTNDIKYDVGMITVTATDADGTVAFTNTAPYLEQWTVMDGLTAGTQYTSTVTVADGTFAGTVVGSASFTTTGVAPTAAPTSPASTTALSFVALILAALLAF